MPRTRTRRSDRSASGGPGRSPSRGGTDRAAGGADRALGAVAWIVLAATAVALLAQLAVQASRAVLNTDECFHAHVASVIAATGRLPDRIPELYGGLFYSYPPLLHVLGAAWIRVLGLGSLPELNVVLLAALLGCLGLFPVPGLEPAPRRWAMWLVLTNVALAIYAVRFYAEMLTCVLGLLVALLLLRAVRSRSWQDGVWLGVAGGLALLAKNTALLVPGLFVAWIALEAIARHGDGVRVGPLALAVALLIGLPMFVRNQLLFGSPIYPGLARDVDPWLMALNHAKFGGSIRFYLIGVWETLGPWVLGLSVLVLAIAIVTRRRDVHAGLVLASLLGIGLAPLSPLHDARHVMPLIAVLALSGSVILFDALRVRAAWTPIVVELALATLAVVAVARLGDRRSPLDVAPSLMDAYAAVHRVVPEGDTVLSLWTYDTFYHSRRAATWPIPWGQRDRSPAPLFRETDPARFAAEMDRLGIRWILMRRGPGAPAFDGANYPHSFVECVATLANRRAARIAWGSDYYVLVERMK